jgi:hypothetical protein
MNKIKLRKLTARNAGSRKRPITLGQPCRSKPPAVHRPHGPCRSVPILRVFVTVDRLQLRRVLALNPRTFQHFVFRRRMLKKAILEHHVQRIATGSRAKQHLTTG